MAAYTARQVLRRFAKETRWAARQAADRFPVMDYDDCLQEARTLVLTYAGLTKAGWHNGRLDEISKQAQGKERQIHRILATDLKADLNQIVGRQMNPLPTTPLEFVVDTKHEPSDEHDLMEDRIARRVDFDNELPRLRKDYPILVAHVVDQLTEVEIAEALGCTDRWIREMLSVERAKAANDPFFGVLLNDGNAVSALTQDDFTLAV